MNENPTTEYDDLLFGVRRSVRYHDRRVSFYDRSHNLVLFLVLIGGSSAVVTFTAEFAQGWPIWTSLLPAALVSALAGLDLVIGSARKARKHDILKYRFIALEARMIAAGSLDETQPDWLTERLMIESEEPPVLRVLDTICHNDLMRSMGYPPKDFIRVGPIQRFFSPMFDMGANALR